jgi:23S rRNA (pseudouridine1915-N3)-methyltransferase
MAVGRTQSDYLVTGIDNYIKRIGRYMPMEFKVIPDIKASRSLSEAQQKEQEGRQMLAALMPGDVAILLDERGRQYTSREFAGLVDRYALQSVKRLVFIIGGPYGFSKEVYDRADSLLSLSKMTFSHEMVRLFFVEQIYRAMTILRGEPYHHD